MTSLRHTVNLRVKSDSDTNLLPPSSPHCLFLLKVGIYIYIYIHNLQLEYLHP